MRVPGKAELAELARLCHVREQIALSELAEISARRNAAAARVHELRAQSREAAKSPEVAAYQKWLLWRDQEMTRSLQHLARLSAEHAEASQRCGRVIAENAVVETLTDLSTSEAAAKTEKRRLDDLSMTSHLLTNNVGDQDI